MPRTTPTTSMNQLGGYDLKPDKDISDYVERKKYAKDCFLKPPNVLIPLEDTLHMDIKQEYEFQQQQLKKLKREQKIQNEHNAERIKHIREMYEEQQAEFVKFNNFVRERDEERKTGRRKINKQIELQKQLKVDIEIKRKMVDELLEFRKIFSQTNEEYRSYEEVLENVVQRSEKFNSVKELINYCDAIMVSRDEISNLNDGLVKELEQFKKRMIDIVKKASLIIVGLKNELFELAHTYAKAQQEVLRWERISNEAHKAVLKMEFNKLRIRDATWLIYRLLCKHRRIFPGFVPTQVEKTMTFIRDEVELLRAVLEEYKRRK